MSKREIVATKKAFAKKTDFPLQLFLPKVASTPPNPGSLSGLVLPLPLPHILEVQCMLRQAPIEIKAQFPGRPFRTSAPNVVGAMPDVLRFAAVRGIVADRREAKDRSVSDRMVVPRIFPHAGQ